MKRVNTIEKLYARPILLVARNSGQQSGNARRAVANECHNVAADLHRTTGVDVRQHVPSADAIVALLKDPKRTKRIASVDFKSGNKFTNEYLLLELAPNVTMLVSTGSGAKLDKNLGQPFLDFLNALLRSLKPGVFIWHRIDRVFRTALLCANTIHICDVLETKMIDGESGPLEGDFASFMLLLRAREAAEEARKTPKKTRDGQSAETGLKVVEGSAAYAVAMSPPAGMMALRMKAPNGHRGKGLLTFDTPTSYPDPATVAYGLPEVYLDGERVDQVELVRGALKRLGKPGWGLREVARWLMARSFSTHRLRLMNTASTAYTAEHVKGECERVVRSIRDRLDFYETGVLPIHFGVPDVEDLDIVGCFPPDGRYWATPADFERIRKYLASTRGGGPASLGLVGVVVETQDGAFPLRKAPADREAGGPSYILRPGDVGIKSSVRMPALPHSVLAGWLVDTLEAHSDSLLVPFLETEVPEAEALREELRDVEKAHALLKQRACAMTSSLADVDENGEPILSSRARKALSDQYDEFAETQLDPAAAEVARVRQKIDKLTANALSRDPAIKEDVLLRMVESLLDPYDTTYNHVWKGAVRIHKVTKTRETIHGLACTLIRCEGTVRTEGADHEFVAPFVGEYRVGAATVLPDLVEDALAQLLEGIPFASIDQPNARSVQLALAEHLGFDSRYFGLASCRDPRLVRIAAHLAKDPERSVAKVSELLDEPDDLVRAVLKNLVSGRPTWHAISGLEPGADAA